MARHHKEEVRDYPSRRGNGWYLLRFCTEDERHDDDDDIGAKHGARDNERTFLAGKDEG